MARRATLTPRLVFETEAPKTGELWIADTKIRGFGLRLWSTSSGGRKAFAIRASNIDGKIVRKTFNIHEAWQTRFDFAYSAREDRFGLGEYLEDARDWARDEIDRIKGRPTVDERVWAEHRAIGRLVQSLPFGKAARSLLSGLRASSTSQRYLDRLDKLFENHIPDELKQTPLAKLKPEQVAKILAKSKLSPGNVRTLRAFVSQILERGASFNGPLGRFQDRFASAFSTEWNKTRKVRYPELNRLSDKKYERLFQILESETEYWQQALAIRLYFEFHAPLARLLSAKWNQLYDSFWYPYAPGEKAFWFECREKLSEDAKGILDRLKKRAAAEFNSSSFWFPSNARRSSGHIQSVDHVWRVASRKCALGYYPLREFSRSYREFNNPSYYISFIRQYKPTFDKALNVAELSKNVARARKM
jgi:hypothetical protein